MVESSDRALRILRQHVMTDRLLGADALPKGEVVVSAPAAPVPRDAVLPAEPPPAPAAPRVTRPAPAFAPIVSKATSDMDRQGKIAILDAIDRDEVRGCTKCELCRGRIQTVFGDGDPDAKLMFVGEGPGETEDRLGKPFVGKAGDLLEKMIIAMGLTREQVYIANVVKCRPPNNRTPTPPEVDACSDYLRRQIMTIQPKVIVTLGGPATKLLLQTSQGITAVRGTWHTLTGGLLGNLPPIPVMPTFHPAYVLRQYTKETRGKVWSDLQKVMEVLKQGD